MRILIIDVSATSLNPTTRLATPLFRRFADVSMYGPGFVSNEVLAGGLGRFLGENPKFDWIVLGPFAPAFDSSEEARESWASYVSNYCVSVATSDQLRKFFGDVSQNWGIIGESNLAIWLLNFDYYAATRNQVDWLLRHNCYPICPNKEFAMSNLGNQSMILSESHYKRKKDRISNVWFEYLADYEERILTSLHFVADSEFVFSDPRFRDFDVSVPGVGYAMRKEARDSIRRSSLKVDKNLDVRLIRLADKIGLKPFRRSWALDLYQRLYSQSLASTSMAYIAPGGFGLPVRKYFEAPAAGCAVLGIPCLGFDQIGFVEGEHYLRVKPAEVGEMARKLKGSEILASVGIAGQNLVWDRHSLGARAQQLETMMTAVLEGTFRGAEWNQGHFKIIEDPKSSTQGL